MKKYLAGFLLGVALLAWLTYPAVLIPLIWLAGGV